MRDALARRTPVELSAEPRFAARIRRLAATATVALGALWWLSVATLEAPAVVDLALLSGWILMPAILVASLAEPRWRYALVLPSALIGAPLLGICAFWLHPWAIAAAGWILVTAGILFGSLLGVWFWYRLLPVPVALDEPFSPGRWVLIAAHIALIVVGLLLAATPLVLVA